MNSTTVTIRDGGITSAIDLVDAISWRKLNAQDAMEHCLARIAKAEPDIHAFVDLHADEARV